MFLDYDSHFPKKDAQMKKKKDEEEDEDVRSLMRRRMVGHTMMRKVVQNSVFSMNRVDTVLCHYRLFHLCKKADTANKKEIRGKIGDGRKNLFCC